MPEPSSKPPLVPGDDKSAKPGAMERARRDLVDGRPDRARDRITGFLYGLARAGTYREDAYLLLGDAYWAMKDRPRAGAVFRSAGSGPAPAGPCGRRS